MRDHPHRFARSRRGVFLPRGLDRPLGVDDALRSISQATEDDPGYRILTEEALARHQAATGQSDAARALFQQIADLTADAPPESDARALHLGVLAELQGNVGPARPESPIRNH